MTRYLFAGPSLPDATGLAGITVLPPVAAGDLLRLEPRAGDVVGIVDGYFHQTRAVRHKEILALIDAGVTVLGAASMGALRAAELDTYGMVGVGRVYDDYRLGRLTADDEVALLHGPAEDGYPAISEPLVNIRATLQLGVREDVLDEAAAGRLVGALARRPYRLRSYRALLALAAGLGMRSPAIEALRLLCATRAVNLKRADALALVPAIDATPSDGDRPVVTAPPTVYLHRWQLAARTAATGVGELSVLRMCQLYAPDYPAFHRHLVLAHLARECAGACSNHQPADDLDMALAHARHRGIIPGTDPADPAELTFLDQWLTPAERATQPPREQFGTFLARSFPIAPGVPADGVALDALRHRRVVETAVELVRAATSVNEHTRQTEPTFDMHALSAERIASHLGERWAADPADLELHALDRGIATRSILIAAARLFYLLARYNPGLMNLSVGDESHRARRR